MTQQQKKDAIQEKKWMPPQPLPFLLAQQAYRPVVVSSSANHQG
jgi:hypothetical protein